MKAKSLGERMKQYESANRIYLTRGVPVIIRLDGKAFHTFTKGMSRPFDTILKEAMNRTLLDLCGNIQGVKVGYTQSDEITLLLTDYETIETDAWFDYRKDKVETISASMATMFFNKNFLELVQNYESIKEKNPNTVSKYAVYSRKLLCAMFDSRAFNVPKEDVVNNFIWRQQDASRNSIQMYAQSCFSHKSLQGLNTSMLQEKLFTERGINWNNEPTENKRGVCAYKTEVEVKPSVVRNKWVIDYNIPLFSQDREYISKYL